MTTSIGWRKRCIPLRMLATLYKQINIKNADSSINSGYLRRFWLKSKWSRMAKHISYKFINFDNIIIKFKGSKMSFILNSCLVLCWKTNDPLWCIFIFFLIRNISECSENDWNYTNYIDIWIIWRFLICIILWSGILILFTRNMWNLKIFHDHHCFLYVFCWL